MGDYLATQADWIATGRKYAQSGASEKISEASPLPRGGLEEGGDSGDGESPALDGEQNSRVTSKLSEWFEGIARLNWRERLRAVVRKH
jgi:hypothetical protein